MVTWEVITEQIRFKQREEQLASAQLAAKRDLEEKVNALMRVVQSAAAGDLTQDVAVAGDDDLGRLAAGMRKMLGDLRNVIGEVIEASSQQTEGARTIDVGDRMVLPGLVDTHAHMRDPGFTHKEDWEHGSRAALRPIRRFADPRTRSLIDPLSSVPGVWS